MALYIGNTQISEAVEADENGVYTMTYETTGKALEIGSNIITVKFVGDSNMDDAEQNITVTLHEKNLIISSASAEDRAYDQTDVVEILSVKLDGVFDGDDVSVETDALTCTISDVNSGFYTQVTLDSIALIGEDIGYYTVSSSATVPEDGGITIRAKEVEAEIILSQTSYVYDGSAREPAVTVKDGSTVIPADEYTVSYSDNINQGTAAVTITDKDGGNYTVSGSAAFTITQSGTVFEGDAKADKSEYTYGETITVTAKPIVTGEAPATFSLRAPAAKQMALYIGNTQISEAVEADENGMYTMTYVTTGKALKIGSNIITARFVGDSNMAEHWQDIEVTLHAKPITIADVSAADREYDQTNVASITSVTLDGVLDGDTVYVNTNRLTGTIPGTDTGEYSEVTLSAPSLSGVDRTYYTLALPAVVQMSRPVSVTEKKIAATVILSQTSYEYDGQPKEPAVTVTAGRTVIPPDEYTVTYSNNINLGTAQITVTDNPGGNYTVSGSASFTIMRTVHLQTVSFDGNAAGVTGIPEPQTKERGSLLSRPADPLKKDHKLIGWSTDPEGNHLWDFSEDTLTEDITLYAQWEQVYFHVAAEILDHNGNAYHGKVQIELMRGSDVIESVEGTNGYYDFTNTVEAGMYNLVATYTDTTGEHTKTELITVDHDDTYVLQLPEPGVNSHLNVNNDADTPAVMVGGLDAEAASVKEDTVDEIGENVLEIAVMMEVDGKPREEVSSEIAEKIEETIADTSDTEAPAVIEYLDINVNKEVTTNSGQTTTTPITETNTVIEIVIPFMFFGKAGIKIIRHHGGAAAALIETQNKQERRDGTFYLDIENGYIHIFTRLFSTYAISYTEEMQSEKPVSGITITNTVTALQPGERIQLTAVDEDGSCLTDVVWILNTPTADPATQLSKDGLLIIGERETAGELTIVAQYGTYYDNAIIRIVPPVEYDLWHQSLMMLFNQEFAVTASATAGGTITPAGSTKVKYDRNITYTITPEDGYEISAVLVDGRDVGTVSEYTFKRIKKDHTIEAVFAEIKWQNPFMDVSENDWFYEDIQFVSETGLMNGTAETKFSPDSVLTRAMLVTVLWRLEGEPAVNYVMPFTDVADGEWYTEAVRWAASEGIVNGYEDNTFRHAREITREQVMAILHRYTVYKGLESSVIFPMIPQYNYSLWAENDIIWADMVGLTNGIETDIYDMTAYANRAEIAAVLHRYSKVFG